MRQEPSGIDPDEFRAAGVAAGLGCSIVVSFILLIGGGVLLDRWLGTSPALTLAGVALGLVVAAYQLYELFKISSGPQRAGPVARGISRVTPRRSKPVDAESSGTGDGEMR